MGLDLVVGLCGAARRTVRVGLKQRLSPVQTNPEREEFIADLRAVILPRLANEPAPGRTRRLVSHVFMPRVDSPSPASPSP